MMNATLELVYIRGHRWGIEVDGALYKEYPNFDAAADDYEAMGGQYSEAESPFPEPDYSLQSPLLTA